MWLPCFFRACSGSVQALITPAACTCWRRKATSFLCPAQCTGRTEACLAISYSHCCAGLKLLDGRPVRAVTQARMHAAHENDPADPLAPPPLLRHGAAPLGWDRLTHWTGAVCKVIVVNQ